MSGFRKAVRGISVGIYWIATAAQILLMISATFDWVGSTALAVFICFIGFIVFIVFIGFLTPFVFLYWLSFAFLFWYLEGVLPGDFIIAWGISWASRGLMTISEIQDLSLYLERVSGYFFALFILNLILWLCDWGHSDKAFEIGVVTFIVALACQVIAALLKIKKEKGQN